VNACARSETEVLAATRGFTPDANAVSAFPRSAMAYDTNRHNGGAS